MKTTPKRRFKINRVAALVTTSLLASMAITPSVYAQQQLAQDDQQMETIEVRGIRRSLEASMNTKRFANAVVDAITSEDIGKFPDKNIGDALQRISGVTVDRQYGEVSGVTIRGTAPEQSRVLLNGQSVASTSWYDLGPATRTFNMELLSAEQVSAVEVYKTPKASIEEGALGGTVDLTTRQPLDLDTNTLMVSAELARGSLYDETDAGGAFLASWKDEQERFGILASYSIEQLTSGRHVLESIGSYYEYFAADPDTGQESTVGAWAIGSQAFRAERERTSAQLTAQFAPTDNTGFVLDYFRFELDNPHVNHNFLTVGGRGSGSENVQNNALGGTEQATITPAYASIIYNPVVRNAVNMKADVLNLSGKYIGDTYEVSAVLGQSTSDGGTQFGASSWWIPATDEGDKIGDPAFENGQNSTDGGFSYDATGPYQVWLSSLDATDASQFKHAQEANFQTTVQEHDIRYAQADIKWLLSGDLFTSIEAGVKVNSSEFSRVAIHRNPADVIGFVPNGNLSNWSDGVFTDLHSQSSGHILDSYAKLDEDQWWDFISGKYEAGELIETSALGDTFGVDEDMLALYVQSDFSGEYFRGNVGLRYVDTEQTSSGYADGQAFKETVDYDNWLPSINIAFDVSDDVIVRAAASSVMSRVNYSDLKPGLAIQENFGSANGGNPYLKPYEADQADLGVEYYFTEASLFSAAAFVKQIDNVVFLTEEVEFVDGCGAQPSEYDSCRVTRPRSNGDGDVTGLELQLQHTFANGFGFVSNYTYVDSETTRPDGATEMVPGVSENSFNGSLFYENDHISARIAYNWRSEWIGVGAAQAVRNDDYQQWDASIVWHAMENLDISLEGVNLTNEVIQSYDTNYDLTQNTIEFGSRYYLSASYKF
ncbi:TonB-dependent receptor [Pseudoalteromonas ruthenica]|uniref:TonB-dependent receptor n=2 Tax=Pseudoalteromonas ruthenica TaxID=151081 RepID=A0A0F4PXX2_9GAMM|nr:TonB-dependent receptor [Pseudoalteromonas ruthenica]KJY95849.1 TonB-dependent receptor [Pseudoalteromonas ruthenica]KJZ00263.1 TonB-dependent receptor [Pseudoalteromonas ruthenica]TMO90415.1 TonB-dependent receptor [Pseudoalteromonas ruthenica]TMO91901.1 TonB-dependent receptor [Pseudoalteromonas ruthenica]TMO96631.1 TonB-dependent receptor [Pseudoalteromonas ruthenica]